MLKETSTQKTISTPFLSTGFTVTPVFIPEIAIIKLKIPINLKRIFNEIVLEKDACFKTSWLIELSKAINTAPSLYLSAGAIHGCVLCQRDQPLVYMEDIGRHNAVDKIAGWMFLNEVTPHDKVFYTTGRLTTEMVIKTVQMQIPVLVSRSGFTAAAIDLAREAGLTLIGRAKGKRFLALSGIGRIVFDSADAVDVVESASYQRAVQRDVR